jgi:hypothetical protein
LSKSGGDCIRGLTDIVTILADEINRLCSTYELNLSALGALYRLTNNLESCYDYLYKVIKLFKGVESTVSDNRCRLSQERFEALTDLKM